MQIKKKYVLIAIGSFLLGLSTNIKDNLHYNINTSKAECSICFTPGNPCTQKIIERIKEAKQEILVQAFSFTSTEIAQALIQAHEKGVKVNVIVDRTQEDTVLMIQLAQANIPVFIDKPPGIAHNKVMIIDNFIVLTGSFNFTKAAQIRNVENSICIRNNNIAKQYKTQWEKRLALSYQYLPKLNVEEAQHKEQERLEIRKMKEKRKRKTRTI
jgi:phosphatidylserine/phosphatidylglycerophosphate/cardiolipin synthase-like enzyme